MKKFIYLLAALWIFTGCETEVSPNLSEPANIVVIDAWLTNQGLTQHINVTRSQAYFEESAPPKIPDAVVTVTDLTDPGLAPYLFQESEERYTWNSPDGNPLGIVGHTYELEVVINGVTYTSRTTMSDVPEIDSLTFRLEEGNAFFDDLIIAEFFATDLEGVDDTYWIRSWRNGAYLGEPDEIVVAYDAAFGADPDNDNLPFIQPIRDAPNPFEEAHSGDLLSPYLLPDTFLISNDSIFDRSGSIYGLLSDEMILIDEDNEYVSDDIDEIPLDDERFTFRNDTLFVAGDSVHVEIHSISNDAWFFMNQVVIETTRSGGFGALFATPLANVSTNIVPETPENRVAGFFNVAAVSGAGRRLNTENEIRVLF